MEQQKPIVWVVTYFDKDDPEATVALFDNAYAADKYKEYLINKHTHVAVDPCPVYSVFDTPGMEDTN